VRNEPVFGLPIAQVSGRKYLLVPINWRMPIPVTTHGGGRAQVVFLTLRLRPT
jgi:hypothetical protein